MTFRNQFNNFNILVLTVSKLVHFFGVSKTCRPFLILREGQPTRSIFFLFLGSNLKCLSFIFFCICVRMLIFTIICWRNVPFWKKCFAPCVLQCALLLSVSLDATNLDPWSRYVIVDEFLPPFLANCKILWLQETGAWWPPLLAR